MVNELASMGIELMVTFWPFMSPQSVNWQTFNGNGYLAINRNDGKADIFWEYLQGGALIDSTNAAARKQVFDNWWANFGSLGIRSIWLDETEPDRSGYTYGEWQLAGGADWEVGVAWKQQWIATFYEGLQSKGIKDGEFFLLSRSAWVGTQRYGNAVWSGDVESTFDELQMQVRAALGAGMSGQGTWTSDAGGYDNGDPTTPEFQELIVRWLQFASFSSIMRLHGHREGPAPPANECGFTNGDNEIWNLAGNSSVHYDAMVAAMRLREQLRDYVHATNLEFVNSGMPMMRPLFLQFPNDAGSQGSDTEDQFMFGSDWLVAPVLEYQATSRSVYFPALPSTEQWVYWWNQSVVVAPGGVRVDFPTPISEFPLFKRAVKQL
jgi:alpha-D-xyloside xylohydrolase